MVWSASAVVAMERYQQPYMFLTKQLMWATMGLAVLWGAMGIDYRVYKQARFIWACLGDRGAVRSLRCCSARPSTTRGAGSVSVDSAFSRRNWPSSPSIFFIASMLDRRMHRINEIGYSLLPIGLVVGLLSR